MAAPAPLASATIRVIETSALAPRDAVGRLWRVVVIQEGVSANRYRYPAEVLERDHRVFEGVPVAVSWEALDHHDPVGVLRAVACERIDGRMAITADAEITDGPAQRRLLEAYRAGRPYEFSIDAQVRATEGRDAQGRTTQEVTAILAPTELTIVRRGAAGGRVQRLVASASGEGADTPTVTGGRENVGHENGRAAEAAATSRGTGGDVMPATAEKSTETKATAGAGATNTESSAGAGVGVAPAPSTSAASAELRARESETLASIEKARKAAEDAAAAAKAQADAAERRARESEFRAILGEKLADVRGLPKEAIARVRESFLVPGTIPGADGKPVATVSVRLADGAAIDAAIKAERDYLARIAESFGAGRVSGLGAGAGGDVEIGTEARDRYQAALDGLFAKRDVGLRAKESEKVPRFRSFSGAIETVMGRRLEAEEALAACYGYALDSGRAGQRGRVRESLQASSFGEILGDSITRRLLKTYQTADLIQILRSICSAYGNNIKDFRTNRRPRMGGYGLLPTVAEGNTYAPLSSPSDEEVTFSVAKKGGTEDITLEMIANDDVGVIAKIPDKLALAAAETLGQTVLDYIKNNTTIYDSSALFRSGNKTSSALSKSTLNAARVAMRQQSPYGDTTKKIGQGNVPKFLLVPADLEETALRFSRSGVMVQDSNFNATETPNMHAGITPLVVDYWTDTADCAVVGDPMRIDTIEVGFLNGREDPELFVQDQPNVGSMFNADKQTWKIRHIWGFAYLDYRGFYGFSRA